MILWRVANTCITKKCVLTKNLKAFECGHVEGSRPSLLVEVVLYSLVDLASERFVAFGACQDVVENPKGQAKGVVVDMQVDQIVAFDLVLCLPPVQHVLHGRLDVVRAIRAGEELRRGRLLKEFPKGLAGGREKLLGEAQPHVIEVFVEHLEVPDHVAPVEERLFLRCTEDGGEQGVEEGRGGELAQAHCPVLLASGSEGLPFFLNFIERAY